MKSKLLQHPVQFFDAPTQIVNVFRLGFLVPVAIINLSTFHNLNPFRRTLAATTKFTIHWRRRLD